MDLFLPNFSFAFQPIVNVLAGQVEAFEVLVRGSNGESASQVFQKVHEANRYCFDETLRVNAIRNAVDLGVNCYLNLNFLPRSIEVSKTAVSSLIEVAKESGFPVNKIFLEVTESEVINDFLWFAKAINYYRNFGVNFAIDDFGAGFSGLNLLAEFQPDSIKIDMSLVRNIDSHGPRQAIVRGIIRTCQDLGIDIIAEGVETDREYQWFCEEGIELFQGYFFAKPGFEHLPVAFFPNYEP
ncbi:MAG: EAL domain-containing protein [Spirulina sp. SIO3F2]|nr:EAL domain-containing protein [Spirulina sp. SIO3F2]